MIPATVEEEIGCMVARSRCVQEVGTDGRLYTRDWDPEIDADEAPPAPARVKLHAPRATPRARARAPRRARRTGAKRAASSDPDGEPPPELRPFVEALADLILADLTRSAS